MKKSSKYFALITLVLLGTSTLSATDYFRIKNRWTGQYLHIQHKKGHIELGKKGPLSGWHSAQWSKENTGNGYFRIKNRWTGQYLHIQHKKGNLELDKKGPLSGWHSAQWKKVFVEKGYFRIKNRWTQQYMHIEGKLGHVQLNKTGPRGGWWSSQWKFEKVNTVPISYTMSCRGGGNMSLRYSSSSQNLTLYFTPSGTGTKYGQLKKGECSWVDRKISVNEPHKICQSNVNDILVKINGYNSSITSYKAPYISKVKSAGRFKIKVYNSRGCMVVDN